MLKKVGGGWCCSISSYEKMMIIDKFMLDNSGLITNYPYPVLRMVSSCRRIKKSSVLDREVPSTGARQDTGYSTGSSDSRARRVITSGHA